MNLLPAAVLTAALAAGVAGSVVAYDLANGGEPDQAPGATAPQAPERQPQPRERKPRFKPCKKPAKLEKGVCVIDVVRTVPVAPAAPVPAPPAAAPPVAPVQPDLAGRDDDAGPPDEVEDDDDGDDDHGTSTRTRTRSHSTQTQTRTQTRTRSRDD